MPEKETLRRAARDRREGKSPSTQAGEFVREEVHHVREGKHAFLPPNNDIKANFIEPVIDYHHDVGKSVTGGNVYRGKQVPELEGAYLYADFVTGQIWALWYDFDKQELTANRSIIPRGQPVMTFGEDDQGEVYFATQGGGIYKFASPDATAGP